MAVPKDMREELERRGELILALEMLTVDQACRLLALEAIVVSMAAADKVNAAKVKAHIAQQSKRYQRHFEGESLSGFSKRVKRIADELSAATLPKKAAAKPAAKPKPKAAKPKSKAAKPKPKAKKTAKNN